MMIQLNSIVDYYFTPVEGRWSVSKGTCIGQNGKLASIMSDEQARQVIQAIPEE